MKRKLALTIVSGVTAAVAVSGVAWVSADALGWRVAADSRAAAGRGMAALSNMVRDPLLLLAMRSPGERAPGALMSSKPTRVADRGGEPPATERVLPTVRERPPPILPLGAVPPTEPELIPLLPEGDVLPASLPSPPFGEPTIDGPLVPPWWGPPRPGGGGGGCCVAPPPTSPVPEPATWAMMILGFFSLGAMIRRRRALGGI